MTKIACAAVVKNEARYLAEWLAWQFMLGFDTVVLMDNGSTDETLAIAERFAAAYDVRRFHWADTSPSYQASAYDAVFRSMGQEFEWIAFFDADEFLLLDDGLELKTLLAARPEAAIAIPWAIFGSSGRQEMQAGLTVETYTHRSGAEFYPNRHVKSIIRPARTGRCATAHVFEVDGAYVDLLGNALDWQFLGVLAVDPAYRGGRLNHYFTRSQAEWQQKLARGYPDRERAQADFFEYDRNEIFDDSAARRAPAVNAILAQVEAAWAQVSANPKVAVVLIVKDEAADILAWLTWYHGLGVNTCIIYDDGSTDGTYEMLQAAATVQDIRLHKSFGPQGANHEPRQELCYRDALTRYGAEFAWIGFFDADEFLFLAEDATVQPFLTRFGDAGQVCINWCNYGSSGHYLKPAAPAYDAYTWHSGSHHLVNRHVKSFVRPDAVGPAWVNVHCFDVKLTRLANGAPAIWGAAPGMTAGDPDWSVAKIMHYQCRSMDHFLDRLKKRRNLQDTGHLWENYDFKDFEDRRPLGRAADLATHFERLANAPRPAGAGAKYKYSICACARWETPFIVEWLTYYQALGFDHVFLYCNDDDPADFFDAVLPFTQGKTPFVTLRHHPIQGQQFEMYTHFLAHFLKDTEWVSFFDIDEFLRLPPGEKIGDFMARFGPAVDSVLFNWVPFGPNGHKTYPAGRVLENFTRREEDLHVYTKYVTKSSAFTTLSLTDREQAHGFWHEIVTKISAPILSVNVLGDAMTEYYKNFPQSGTAYVNEPERRARILGLATMHHYSFRSEQAFWDRSARGLGGDFDTQYVWRDLAEGPRFMRLLAKLNAIEDSSLAYFWVDKRQELQRINSAASNPNQPISRYKHATQSSVLENALPGGHAGNASAAVNGRITGGAKFHTAQEHNPWWQVDLGAFATIHEIHIYNVTDDRSNRCKNLSICISIDGSAWAELARTPPDEIVGNKETGPYKWNGPGTAWGRYIRIMLMDFGCLHLDQVEIFGSF
jgi:glycosyltransferase involved in cell wall biosynthesis